MKHYSQSGTVLPIIIIVVLLVGLAVATNLVNVQQIFKSQAENPSQVTFAGQGVTTDANGNQSATSQSIQLKLTSPYGSGGSGNITPKAGPIFQTDFNDRFKLAFRSEKRCNFLNQTRLEYCWDVGYVNGVYRVSTTTAGTHLQSGMYDKVSREFSMVFDAKYSGPGSVGIAFGGTSNDCDYHPSLVNCYRVYINNPEPGRTTIYYGAEGNTKLFDEPTRVRLVENQPFKMRFDRSINSIKGWISFDSGASWQQFINAPLDPAKGTGTNLGFVVAFPQDSQAKRTITGEFDNLLVYKLGDLPEPGTGQGATFYRYAGSAADITSDQNGERVRWQPYTSHPTFQLVTLPEGVGTKTMCAQFKSASGEVSQVWCAAITLTATGSDAGAGAPFMLNATCLPNVDGRRVRLSWSSPQEMAAYKLRVNNTSRGSWKGCGAERKEFDVCQEALTYTSYEMGVDPNDTYDFWVHGSNGTRDTDASVHYQFKCGTAAPPAGIPHFTTSSMFVNASNQLVIRGSNFGSRQGTIYYSRGGSHEVRANVISWSDTEIKVSKGINDPQSPVANSIVEGQYLRVCQQDQSKCSPYVVLPSMNATGG